MDSPRVFVGNSFVRKPAAGIAFRRVSWLARLFGPQAHTLARTKHVDRLPCGLIRDGCNVWTWALM